MATDRNRFRAPVGAALGLVGCLTLVLLATSCRRATESAVPPPAAAQGSPPAAEVTAGAGAAVVVTATAAQAASGAALATARVEALLPKYQAALGGGELMLPVGVATDEVGNVYVSDATGAMKFGADGKLVLRFGTGELKTALGGIAVGGGRVYVTGFDSLVHVYAVDGSPLGTIGQQGSAAGQLAKPVDAALDASGQLYVVDAENARVEVFNAEGDHVRTIGERGEGRGQFRTPRAVALDADGNVYVGQGDDFLIQRFGPDGTYLDTFGDAHAGENVWRVGGIAVDPRGQVYVAQAMSATIQGYSAAPELALKWELGSLGAGPGEFSTPLGIDVRDSTLYVADQQNNRIQVFQLAP